MGQRGLRVLVLACCLPLVLPPGWCCWLLPRIDSKNTSAAAGRTTPAKSSGLCCCFTQDAEPPTPNDEKQPQEPRKPPFKHCPCSDRQTTPPSVSTVEHDDGGFVVLAVLPFSDSSPRVSSGVEKFAPLAHPPACRIHIRNCVWRC